MTDTATDLSFLAPAGLASDWRLVLLLDSATETGLLGALPGLPRDLAATLGLDEHAVTVVLAALAVYGVVEAAADGSFTPGKAAPGPEAQAVLAHHARALRQWAGGLTDRLRGAPTAAVEMPRPLESWLDALASYARKAAPESVDTCLAHVPGAASVLDLGGGHGEYALEFARRGLAVTLQDLPEVIDIARSRGVLDAAGVGLYAGDFFASLPDGPFDLVLCSGVTNMFDGERNRALYDRVRPCLAPDGRFVIQSFLRDRHATAPLFGVAMLVAGNGGDAHPEPLYREWLAATGYGPPDVVDIEDGRRTLLLAPPAPAAAPA